MICGDFSLWLAAVTCGALLEASTQGIKPDALKVSMLRWEVAVAEHSSASLRSSIACRIKQAEPINKVFTRVQQLIHRAIIIA